MILQNALILIFTSCKGAYNYTISMQPSPRRQCSAVFKRIFKVRKIWVCELSNCKSLLCNSTRFQVLHFLKNWHRSSTYGKISINIKWNNGQAIFRKRKLFFLALPSQFLSYCFASIIFYLPFSALTTFYLSSNNLWSLSPLLGCKFLENTNSMFSIFVSLQRTTATTKTVVYMIQVL